VCDRTARLSAMTGNRSFSSVSTVYTVVSVARADYVMLTHLTYLLVREPAYCVHSILVVM